MLNQFEGFHGTSVNSAKEILKFNYNLSIGDNEWIGNGVYFFVTGISSVPAEQAKKWSIAQSWDNILKSHNYKRYCVIKSSIEVDDSNLLDLTKSEGVEILNYFLQCFENKIKRLNKRFEYIDGLLINFAREEGILPIDVVKGNFYIKFAKERINNFNLRTPNCTICNVFDPNNNIVNTQIISIGDIKDEIN